MNLHRLTFRIALVSLAALLVFLGGLVAALTALRDRIDHSAEVEATRYVETRLQQMQAAFAALTVDYTVWDDAWIAARDFDLDWLYDNVFVSVDSGAVFHAVVLADGVIGRPLVWREGGGRLPQVGLLPQAELDRIRAEVAAIGDESAARGLLLIDGRLAKYAAARLRPSTPAGLAQAPPDSWPLFVGVRFLGDDALAGIEAALTLSDLDHAMRPVPGRSAVQLLSPDGRSLGYLTWLTARPGTAVIAALRPLFVVLGVGVVALTLVVALLVRANAARLIQAEAQARALARRDPLTGLPNRLAMNEHLAAEQARGRRSRSVLYIDLNGFKRVNDMLGHAAGDAIVAEVGRRLAALVRRDEFVARVGGDEFVVLPGNLPSASARAEELARRIATDVVANLAPDERRIPISAAIGLALDEADSVPLTELVRRADLAMLDAKRDRRGALRAYSVGIEAIAAREAATEQALRAALRDGTGFSIHYQPIVSAADGRLVRAEALARWSTPELGPVRPDLFIGLAEASGLIPALGRHLLSLIAADLATCPRLEVSINVSPLQLQDPGFAAELATCAVRHGIDPARIELEITERVLIDDPDAAAIRLDALHEAGFSTAIDDFGIGFSSLGVLRRLPFRTLKIDRSFVMGAEALAANAGLIDGIVRIGHAMGQSIVAEGVETADQAAVLRRLGCDLFQGYHFGRPMPLADFRSRWLVPARDPAAGQGPP